MSRHRNVRNFDLDDYDDGYDDYYEEGDYEETVFKSVQKLPPAKVINVKTKLTPHASNSKPSATKSTSGTKPNSVQKTTSLTVVSNSNVAKIKEVHLTDTNLCSQKSMDLNSMGFGMDAMNLSSVVSIPNFLTRSDPMSSAIGAGLSTTIPSANVSDDEFDDSTVVSPAASQPSRKAHLTMVVAGHVDAGKSTLVGNLLYKMGTISQRIVHKYEKESQVSGKSSFYLAWVMDEDPSEREHGVTIGIAERNLRTEKYDVTVLDAPGHRDYIPNMISGAAVADVALLVIPAAVGEFESAMGSGAQTREHAMLLKALGVTQVLVAVNKLDVASPPWSQARFLQVQTQLSALLVELQFPPKAVRFVPVSGLSGENLCTLSETCVLKQWYSGPTLLQCIDGFREPPRRLDKPVRAFVSESGLGRGDEFCVRVLQGRVRKGRRLGTAGSTPGVYHVDRIYACVDGGGRGEEVAQLAAGVTGHLIMDRNCDEAEGGGIRVGSILWKGPPSLVASTRFLANILTMPGLIPPIIPGSSFELYLLGNEVQCNIREIRKLFPHNNTSSEERESCKTSNSVSSRKKPKCVPGGRSATVVIETVSPVCVEPFTECKALGRFALRAKGKTCAVGICEKIPSI